MSFLIFRYRENMHTLSNVMKDVPISPSEAVVYWTNYVLKHNGALYLRTVGADMPLFQYLLLDVIGFIAAVVILSFYSLICLFRRIYRLFSPSKSKNTIEKRKKKQ